MIISNTPASGAVRVYGESELWGWGISMIQGTMNGYGERNVVPTTIIPNLEPKWKRRDLSFFIDDATNEETDVLSLMLALLLLSSKGGAQMPPQINL